MRVAALYDIHGNLPALEAVLRDVESARVDLVVIGGDVVPGPMPRETIERLLKLEIPVRFIRGNGDRVVLDCMAGIEPAEVPENFRDGIRWNAEQLNADHQRVLTSWPPTTRLEIDGIGEVLFCHATPRNDTEIFTRATPSEKLVSIFSAPEAHLIVCGHTHMQFDRMLGELRVVNAGSVGTPFGEPGAYWVLLGPRVELRRTIYDLNDAANRIRRTEYPDAANFAANSVLCPPSEAAMLEAFSKAELK